MWKDWLYYTQKEKTAIIIVSIMTLAAILTRFVILPNISDKTPSAKLTIEEQKAIEEIEEEKKYDPFEIDMEYCTNILGFDEEEARECDKINKRGSISFLMALYINMNKHKENENCRKEQPRVEKRLRYYIYNVRKNIEKESNGNETKSEVYDGFLKKEFIDKTFTKKEKQTIMKIRDTTLFHSYLFELSLKYKKNREMRQISTIIGAELEEELNKKRIE